MIIIYLACPTFRISYFTVLPTLPVFQLFKICIQYTETHPRKNMLYPYVPLFKTNIIRMKYIGVKCEYHLNQTLIECNQYDDNTIYITCR